jgi:hypothetical protein
MKYIGIVLLFLLLIFLDYFHTINAITQDLGEHIRTGQIILQTHSVPHINLYSYTNPTFHFINPNWLSQVIFYLIYSVVNLHGLLIFTIVIAMLTFLVEWAYVMKKVNLYAFSIVNLLALGIIYQNTDIRPEIFSFLFLSIFVTVLYSYKKKFTRLIFLLPFLELLWVNMHIYFITGAIVLWLFVIDECIGNRETIMLALKKRVQLPKKTLVLFFVAFFATLAMILNPNGINGASYPFTFSHNYGYHVKENLNIFAYQMISFSYGILLFEITSILLIVLLLYKSRKTRPVDWLLSVTFISIAITAERNLPLFVFATFIPFTKLLSHAFESSTVVLKLINKYLFYIIICFFALEAYFFITTTTFGLTFGWSIPVGWNNAADFFIKNDLKGPIYNSYDNGSYLVYRLYPKEKVFVDARPEAYPENFNSDVDLPSQVNPAFFAGLVIKDHINTIFFFHAAQVPQADQFTTTIINNPQWKLVYLDQYNFIMVKNVPQNKRIIDKFALNDNNYQIPHDALSDKTSLELLIDFFDDVNWDKQEVKALEALIAIDPRNCMALRSLNDLVSIHSFSKYKSQYQSACKD